MLPDAFFCVCVNRNGRRCILAPTEPNEAGLDRLLCPGRVVRGKQLPNGLYEHVRVEWLPEQRPRLSKDTQSSEFVVSVPRYVEDANFRPFEADLLCESDTTCQ